MEKMHLFSFKTKKSLLSLVYFFVVPPYLNRMSVRATMYFKPQNYGEGRRRKQKMVMCYFRFLPTIPIVVSFFWQFKTSFLGVKFGKWVLLKYAMAGSKDFRKRHSLCIGTKKENFKNHLL